MWRDVHQSSKHVVIAVCRGKTIATSTNTPFLHAEMNMLRHIKFRKLRKSSRISLYVTKINGANAMSRPCMHCSAVLKRMPCVTIFYTDAGGTWQRDDALNNPHISKGHRSQITRVDA